MSAYMVDKAHIDKMIRAMMDGASDGAPHHFDRQFRWYFDDEVCELVNYPGGSGSSHRVVSADEMGDLLVIENLRSINYRYPDTLEGGTVPGPNEPYWDAPFRHDPSVDRPSSLETFKMIACYGYQTCEHPGWPTSEAFTVCQALKDRIISHLPGYEEAKGW